jgi:hypothetical protein
LHWIDDQGLQGASEETVQRYKQCIKLLMEFRWINLSRADGEGYTAITSAVLYGAKQVL